MKRNGKVVCENSHGSFFWLFSPPYLFSGCSWILNPHTSFRAWIGLAWLSYLLVFVSDSCCAPPVWVDRCSLFGCRAQNKSLHPFQKNYIHWRLNVSSELGLIPSAVFVLLTFPCVTLQTWKQVFKKLSNDKGQNLNKWQKKKNFTFFFFFCFLWHARIIKVFRTYQHIFCHRQKITVLPLKENSTS